MTSPLRVTFIGLTLSSSWGNGHATTYRALLKALAARGHGVVFLERDQPWYASHRDLTDPAYCELRLYRDLDGLRAHHDLIVGSDAVIVGSYTPDGVAVGRLVRALRSGVTAFYDIDTPVTLAKLARDDFEYISPDLIPLYDLYLSFTGGPTLRTLERRYGSPAARALYCCVDAALYTPLAQAPRYDLGYLGTYSADRQPALQEMLIEPARRAPHRRFIVAGPQYPADIEWPANVDRIEHVGPRDHAAFYASCRFALNVTRADMKQAGYSPSVRLFEAAACGVPILSDRWTGLEDLFADRKEILLVDGADDVEAVLRLSEASRKEMGERGRRRALERHTAERRAAELEDYLLEALEVRREVA